MCLAGPQGPCGGGKGGHVFWGLWCPAVRVRGWGWPLPSPGHRKLGSQGPQATGQTGRVCVLCSLSLCGLSLLALLALSLSPAQPALSAKFPLWGEWAAVNTPPACGPPSLTLGPADAGQCGDRVRPVVVACESLQPCASGGLSLPPWSLHLTCQKSMTLPVPTGQVTLMTSPSTPVQSWGGDHPRSRGQLVPGLRGVSGVFSMCWRGRGAPTEQRHPKKALWCSLRKGQWPSDVPGLLQTLATVAGPGLHLPGS